MNDKNNETTATETIIEGTAPQGGAVCNEAFVESAKLDAAEGAEAVNEAGEPPALPVEGMAIGVAGELAKDFGEQDFGEQDPVAGEAMGAGVGAATAESDADAKPATESDEEQEAKWRAKKLAAHSEAERALFEPKPLTKESVDAALAKAMELLAGFGALKVTLLVSQVRNEVVGVNSIVQQYSPEAASVPNGPLHGNLNRMTADAAKDMLVESAPPGIRALLGALIGAR